MGLRRPTRSTDPSRQPPSSVAIEYESPRPSAESAPEVPSAQRRSGRLPLAVLAIAAAVFAAVVAADDRNDRVAENIRNFQDEESDALRSEPGEATPADLAAPDELTEIEESDFDLDELPSAPDEWIEGATLAWFDGDELRIRRLSTGKDIEIAEPPRIQIPPLSDSLELLGARNRTYAISRATPEISGVISQTWRMVRLGDGVASFGFLEEGADGVSSLATGTLWGPSVRPLVDIGSDATVSVVAGRGFVASYPNGVSELVTGAEIREAPSRLGRIVAASPERLAGVFCDGVGVCVGRLSGWDGGNERELAPTILAAPIVKLFERDDHVFSWSDGVATVVDPDGETRSWASGPPFNDTVVWDPASGLMFWVEQQQLLVLDPFAKEPEAYLVASAGEILLGADADLLLV